MVRLYQNYLSLPLVVITLLLLSACSTVGDRTDFAALLAQTTHEITLAANTLADAAEIGIISRESRDYIAIKETLLAAQTYIELAWLYYIDGDLIDAQKARTTALEMYYPIRKYLLSLQEGI